MKPLITCFFLTIAAASVFADVPREPRPGKYKELYLRSAFTDPPDPIIPDAKPNDLPDWVLVGLSQYVDGPKVKLMNKKDRSRVTIPSEEATRLGFSIKEVKQDRNFIDNAVVTVRKGGAEGEVRFDPAFLVLKKVAGAPAKGGVPAPASKTGKTAAPKRPPIPGRTNTPSRSSNAPPLPGSVPRPGTSATQSRTTPQAGSSKPTRRPRYIPRKK